MTESPGCSCNKRRRMEQAQFYVHLLLIRRMRLVIRNKFFLVDFVKDEVVGEPVGIRDFLDHFVALSHHVLPDLILAFLIVDELHGQGLDVNVLPWDRLEDGQLVPFNVQTEVIHSGPVEGGQDGVDGETLNLDVPGLVLVRQLVLRYPAHVEILLEHDGPIAKQNVTSVKALGICG